MSTVRRQSSSGGKTGWPRYGNNGTSDPRMDPRASRLETINRTINLYVNFLIGVSIVTL